MCDPPRSPRLSTRCPDVRLSSKVRIVAFRGCITASGFLGQETLTNIKHHHFSLPSLHPDVSNAERSAKVYSAASTHGPIAAWATPLSHFTARFSFTGTRYMACYQLRPLFGPGLLVSFFFILSWYMATPALAQVHSWTTANFPCSTWSSKLVWNTAGQWLQSPREARPFSRPVFECLQNGPQAARLDVTPDTYRHDNVCSCECAAGKAASSLRRTQHTPFSSCRYAPNTGFWFDVASSAPVQEHAASPAPDERCRRYGPSGRKQGHGSWVALPKEEPCC